MDVRQWHLSKFDGAPIGKLRVESAILRPAPCAGTSRWAVGTPEQSWTVSTDSGAMSANPCGAVLLQCGSAAVGALL